MLQGHRLGEVQQPAMQSLCSLDFYLVAKHTHLQGLLLRSRMSPETFMGYLVNAFVSYLIANVCMGFDSFFVLITKKLQVVFTTVFYDNLHF